MSAPLCVGIVIGTPSYARRPVHRSAFTPSWPEIDDIWPHYHDRDAVQRIQLGHQPSRQAPSALRSRPLAKRRASVMARSSDCSIRAGHVTQSLFGQLWWNFGHLDVPGIGMGCCTVVEGVTMEQILLQGGDAAAGAAWRESTSSDSELPLFRAASALEPDLARTGGLSVAADEAFSEVTRIQLDETSWVDHVAGWLAGDGELMRLLMGRVLGDGV
jgi:hypothetical protein